MQSAIGPLAPRLTELTAAIDDYNKHELLLKSGHILQIAPLGCWLNTKVFFVNSLIQFLFVLFGNSIFSI